MAVKVSVSMITYNHERYIAQAVEGVLMQQTDFEYEVVIGEDCSTDGTRQILKEYRDRHPDKIRLLLRGENIGAKRNFLDTMQACQGQYVALLDGDDYWTDPYKLQNQVDFLDTYPECSICFTAVRAFSDDSFEPPEILGPKEVREFYSLEYLLEHSPFFNQSTALLRNHLWDDWPAWYYQTPLGDWSLFVLCAQKGLIAYIDDPATAYRIHKGGIWSGGNEKNKYEMKLKTRELVASQLHPKQQELLGPKLYSFNSMLLGISRKENSPSEIRKYARKTFSLRRYSQDKSFKNAIKLLYFSFYLPQVDKISVPLLRALKSF